MALIKLIKLCSMRTHIPVSIVASGLQNWMLQQCCKVVLYLKALQIKVNLKLMEVKLQT